MRKRINTSFTLIIAILWVFTSSMAQGIIVHKKDGTVIEVPYTELDSISTYNLTPDLVEVGGMKTFVVKGVAFNMMFVKGGTFDMGATSEQHNGYSSESREYPAHTVTLSDFYIGQTEVTQELWFTVMNASPSSSYSWTTENGFGDKYPAYYISYSDCQEFITKLNEMTGFTFRMPTEAEWEYAARGGKKSKGYIFSGSNIVDEVAWYEENSDKHNHEVGTKAPNELGIYDMSGNVWEWCSDWYGDYKSESQTNPKGPSTGYYRVNRGGGKNDSSNNCRVAYRDYDSPGNHYGSVGLRLCYNLRIN